MTSACVGYLYDRLFDWYDWFTSLPYVGSVIYLCDQLWDHTKRWEDAIQFGFNVYCAGVFLCWIVTLLWNIINGSLLNEFASSKFVEEKKIIVGYNIFYDEGITEIPRVESHRALRSRLGQGQPGTMAYDIARFRRSVANKKVRLQLITEAAIRIEECVQDPRLINNYVKAAQRRIEYDAEFTADENCEDFFITFDYAGGDVTHHTFSNLIKTHWNSFYSKLFSVCLLGAIVQFLLPNHASHPVFMYVKPLHVPLLLESQKWLYYVVLSFSVIFVSCMGYNALVSRFYKWIHSSIDFFPDFIRSHVVFAAKLVESKQRDDQNQVMRSLLNKVSEKLGPSNWPNYCKSFLREVPEEFWARSGIARGRYLLVATSEKEPSVQMSCTRLWLIHPYDLYLLTTISKEDIDKFQVDFEGKRDSQEHNRDRYPYVGHKLRVHHLRQWALKEFNLDGTRIPVEQRRHTSLDIIMPN